MGALSPAWTPEMGQRGACWHLCVSVSVCVCVCVCVCVRVCVCTAYEGR
jgi:hypothetical protein